MGLKWNDLNLSYRESLESGLMRVISNMSEQEVANSIHALGSMKVIWINLPSSLQEGLMIQCEKVFPSMISQGISSLLIGFYKMDIN